MTATTTLFPNETLEYREARDRLLEAELDLREAREQVARMVRELPPGPVVSQDYTFKEGPADPAVEGPERQVKLSELFGEGRDSLIVVNYMFGPNDDAPCPMCTMWADGYDAIAPHVEQRAGFVLVAATEVSNLRALARSRGWRNIRLLSSHGNSFNRDYQSENDDCSQRPGVTVFHRDPDGTIRLHHYTEMMLSRKARKAPGQDERGIDPYTPVWNLFDLLPEGRGDWYPSLSYGAPEQPAMLDVDIRHSTLIRADPERAWQALTTAEGMNAWFTTGAEWTHEPGSVMRWRWENWGTEHVTVASIGEILEIEPLERFVFSWANGSEASPSIVTMTFEPHDDGTRVELTDCGYPDTPAGRSAQMDCACGWGEALTLAKVYVEHGARY